MLEVMFRTIHLTIYLTADGLFSVAYESLCNRRDAIITQE